MKYNCTKRLVALLMVCLMVFGMMPVDALAADSGVVNMNTMKFSVNPRSLNTDLSNFLYSAEIENLPADGTIYPGQDYTLDLVFRETRDYQFDKEDRTYTFQLPEGLIYSNTTSKEAIISGVYNKMVDGTPQQITASIKASYTIINGVLSITLPEDETTTDYLSLCTDGKLNASISVKYDEEKRKTEIAFADNIKVQVKPVDTSLILNKAIGQIEKDPNDPAKYIVHYTVTAKANGTQKNVIITDTISGSALTCNQDASSSGTEVTPSITNTTDGFTATYSILKDGETATINYTAWMKRDDTTAGKDIIDEESTKNSVTAKSDSTTEIKVDVNLKGQKPTVQNLVSKSGAEGTEVEIGGKKYKVINWTIKVNEDLATELNGVTITDQIKVPNSTGTGDDTVNYSHVYYGEGITDTTVNDEGNTVQKVVKWTDSGMAKYDTYFTYTFGTDDKGVRRSHTITYQTLVQVDQYNGVVNYENSVSTSPDKPGSGTVNSSAGVSGTKPGGAENIQLTKKAISANMNDKYIVWEISASVPETASKVEFYENSPNNAGKREDIIQINVQGVDTTNGESWQVSDPAETWLTGQKKITINLKEKKNSELMRIIKVIVRTEIDSDFCKTQISEWNNVVKHTNNVSMDVYINEQKNTKQSQAEITTSGQSIAKGKRTWYAEKWGEPNGVASDGMPIYSYTIALIGVDDSINSIVIREQFDEEIFELGTWSYFQGKNTKYNGDLTPNGTSVADPSSNTITISNITLRDAGQSYFVYYYLKVKDAAALKKLRDIAGKSENKTYTIVNTAIWGNIDSATNDELTYKFDPIQKSMEAPTTENGFLGKFKITVNENKEDLDSGDTLTVVDEMTNLSLVGDVTMKVDGTPSTDFSYTLNGDTLTMIIPDNHKVELEYTAQVMQSGKFDNLAKLLGYSSTGHTEGTIDMSSSVGGEGTGLSVAIRKVNEADRNQVLQGVKFELWMQDGANAVWTKLGETQTNEQGMAYFAEAGEHGFFHYDAPKSTTDSTWACVTYKLVEDVSTIPDGYVRPTSFEYMFRFYKNPKDMQHTPGIYDYVAMTGYPTIVVTNTPKSFKIKKVGEDGNTILPNVRMKLTNTTSGKTYSWYSGSPKIITEFKENDVFILSEEPLEGYVGLRTNIRFKVDAEGNITIITNDINYNEQESAEVENNNTLKVTNLPNPGVSILKIDEDTGKGISGGNFKVEAKNGNYTETWSSDGTAHELKNIQPGVYTFTEVSAPNGYEVLNSFDFTVTDDYEVTLITNASVGTNRFGVIVVPNKKTSQPQHPSIKLIKKAAGEDGALLSGAKFTLTKQGETVGQEVTTGNDGTYTIENLADGTYTLTETEAPAGYKKTDETLTITVKDGEVTATSATPYAFVVANSTTPATITVTNDREDTFTLKGRKLWVESDGLTAINSHPSNITLTLKAEVNSTPVKFTYNGTIAYEHKFENVSVADDENGTWEISGLPRYHYDENGVASKITYKVKEAKITGYHPYATGSSTPGYDIDVTNTFYPEAVVFKGTKVWYSDQETISDQIHVTIKNESNTLFDNNVSLTTGSDGIQTWEVTKSNSGDTFPKYNTMGQEIEYTVEESVSGYQSKVEKGQVTVEEPSDNNQLSVTTTTVNYAITNTQLISVNIIKTVTKVWKDDSDSASLRPTKITVQLMNGDKAVGEPVELDQENGWSHTWNDLPKNENGAEITYTCKEITEVAGYTTSYSQDTFTITNTLTGTVDLHIEKNWEDGNNQDNLRPEKIVVTVSGNNTSKEYEITPDEKDVWSLDVKNLPKYDEDGKKIDYTVTEVKVDDYDSKLEKSEDGYTFTFTNTHTPGTVNISGEKTWVGDPEDEITIRLWADGIEKRSKKVTAEDEWKWSFTDLPKMEAGKEIDYTITEDPVPGYISKVEGYNVTNTITSVKISKVDVTSKEELEGAHIQILDKDKNVVAEWNSTKEQPHEVTGLKAGETYTLKETVAPEGYEITTDTTFTLDEKGEIDESKTTTSVSKEGVLLVEDEKKSEETPDATPTSSEKPEETPDATPTSSERPEETPDATPTSSEKPEETPNTTPTSSDKPEETPNTTPTSSDKPEETPNTTPTSSDKPEETPNVTPNPSENPEGSPTPTEGPEETPNVTPNPSENPEGTPTPTEAPEETPIPTEWPVETPAPTEVSTATPTATAPTETSVKISKVDVTTEEELEGAHIEILDEDGNVVHEWVSGKEPHEVTGLKTGEKYTLRETVAPEGYTVTTDTHFTLNPDGTINNEGTTTTNKGGVLLVEDKKTSVKISKVDVTTEEELEGAHIEILDEDGNVVHEWVSGKEPHEVTGLKTGEKYTLRETVAPEGYTVTTDTHFTLNPDGTINNEGTTTTNKGGVLLVEDKKTSVKISKVDVTTEEELEGAHIEILDEDGNVVHEWVSGKEPHEVTGLKTGEKYTLRETVAPEGYTVTTDTHFTLNPDGTINNEGTTTTNKGGVLLVEDKKTSVKISKVDVTTEEELEGAHIEILDEDSNVVHEWVSGKEPHEVTGLKTGEKYTLRETVAPEGYTVTTDTHFTLNPDGTINNEGTTTTNKGGVLLVEDKKTSVKISKVDVTTEEELEGAHIEILDEDGNVVHEWVSGKEPHEVTGLKTGEKYTLRETVAPEGYDITTDTHFTLNPDGTINNEGTTTTNKGGVLLVEDKKLEPTPAPVTPTPTVPVQVYTNITVTKVWQDFEDYDHIRPESVEVVLQRRAPGGAYETVETVTLTGTGDTWSYTFTHLPMYTERFATYQYRVREESVADGYTVTYNGYTITNIHEAVTPTPTPSPTPTPEPTPTPLPERFYENVPPRTVTIRYVDGEWVYIDEFGVPLGLVGQTGDDDHLAAVFAGMAALLMMAGALAFIIVRKEKRKQN